METTHYVIKMRRHYRPWWAPWRKRIPLEDRIWANGRRVDDIFKIEIFTSLYDGNSIKLNDHLVESAEVWVDGILHMRVPDQTQSLIAGQILAEIDGRQVVGVDIQSDDPPYNHLFWPPEGE